MHGWNGNFERRRGAAIKLLRPVAPANEAGGSIAANHQI